MEHHLIQNRDIVLFSFQSWDAELGNNIKDMAIELARHNRVLYINRAADRASLLKKKHVSRGKAQRHSDSVQYELQATAPGLWILDTGVVLESINWLPPGWLYDHAGRINTERLAGPVITAMRQLGFSNIILINDNDFLRGRYLREYISCATVIFYIRDYLLGVGYFKRHGPRLEQACLQEADLVVANSAYLAGYAARVNPNSYDIGQGLDFTSYVEQATRMPEDMRHIQKPVIGYTGYVSIWRIDLELVRYLAEQFPEYSFVMAGPIDPRLDTASLKRLPNLYLLGSKLPEEIPGYIGSFDVCINPQQNNAVTAGNYPRKIDEYLAMGKPVVATRTEAMKMFEPYTTLCTTKSEYARQIQHIIDNPAQYMAQSEVERRKSFALTHTWPASIGKLGDAFFTFSKAAVSTGKTNEGSNNTMWMQVLATVFIMAYLLFIYVKFIFF